MSTTASAEAVTASIGDDTINTQDDNHAIRNTVTAECTVSRPNGGADAANYLPITTAEWTLTVSLFTTAFPKGPAFGTMEHVTWREFSRQFQQRREGDKDGACFIPATFTREFDGMVRRLGANLTARTAIALDIESHKQTGEIPPSFDEVVTRIKGKQWAAVIYTSHSHTEAAPRLRVVLPLSVEIGFKLPVVELVADLLGLTGVLDTGKVGAASLFYLPSAALGQLGQHRNEIIEGEPISATWISECAGAVLANREAEQAHQRTEALAATVKRREERRNQGFDPDASVIEAIRDRLSLAGELVNHGYLPVPGKPSLFLYQLSTTGVPGVHILTGNDGVERVFSHHSGDPLAPNNLPSWCSVRAVDVVDVVTILDFGGDRKAALRTLAKRFEIKTQRRAGSEPDDLADLSDDHGPLAASEAEDLMAVRIGAAEELADPLDGLVERQTEDPGAAFSPDVLEHLAALEKHDRPAFEKLRAQLKKAGCRVTQLDRALESDVGECSRRPTQTDILLELAQAADLFHSRDGTSFADVDVNGHRETWPLRAKGFRRWLARAYFEETRGAPSTEALQAALNVLEARAHFDAPERAVYVRVGGLDDRLYLDLGDETWRVVEIDAGGWRVIDDPPVRFRRAAGMQPLPMPMPGGSIERLRPFLNVKTDADFVLAIAWLLAAMRNRGPYPVLVLSGEQGSAKSTFAAILRAMLDPNTAPLRALPREDRDLFIAATNGHVLAFDNVSGLPAWISDTLCRLATGGGFAVRQLYTDLDEVLFDACRPVILNGIEDIVTRPDLADRGLFQTADPIPEERRRPEKELWAAFETERPRILGALLDAVVHGLKRLPETQLEKLPRMADFALWATACETALWPAGAFWSAYCGNRDEAVDSVIDADPISAAVRSVMVARTVWTGTASDLLGALAEVAGERLAKSKTWPDSPRALSGRLRRAATFLRTIGIQISFEREGRARTRTIVITATPSQFAPENAGRRPSASSASSATKSNSDPTNGFSDPRPRTVATDADGPADSGSPDGAPTVRANPLDSAGGNGADGADANPPTQSALAKPSARRRYVHVNPQESDPRAQQALLGTSRTASHAGETSSHAQEKVVPVRDEPIKTRKAALTPRQYSPPATQKQRQKDEGIDELW